MARKRTVGAYVFVDGEWFKPGDKVSADVAGKLPNPKVWGEDVDDDDTDPAPPAPADFPEGEPKESWKVAELEAYAKANGVDLGEASNNADRLKAILGKA